MIGIPDHLQPFCREWVNQPRPKCFRRQMSRGVCFRNASRLALRHRETLRYVEGVCGEMPHAFCVDLQGQVIDPTWVYDAGLRYVGVPFKADWLWQAATITHEWANTLWLVQRLGTGWIDSELLASFDAQNESRVA